MSLKKRYAYRIAEVLLLVVIAVTVTMLVNALRQEDADLPLRELDGWYIKTEAGHVPAKLPDRLPMGPDGTLTLYNDSLGDEAGGLTLSTVAARYNLRICLDDEVLYEYEDESFPRNSQMKGKLSCNVVLPAQLGGHTLSMRYEGREIGLIEKVVLGSSGQIVRLHIMESLPMLAMVAVMLFGSLMAVMIGLYMRYFHLGDSRFEDLAAFLLLCAVWCVTDSPLVRIFSSQSFAIGMISFFAFMLFSIPMVRFISHTGEMKKYAVLDGLVLLLYLNAAAQGVLCSLGIFSMVEMLTITHVLLFGGVLLCIVLLFREYRAGKEREIISILRAFSLLGGSGLLALVLYWGLEFSHYELIFEAGILAFSAVIFNETIQDVIRTFHYRTELDVFRRLTREDGLTGMGNRYAFDEAVAQIQDGRQPCEDAVLMFFRLADLRYTNDHYGMNLGDEMIIGAAHCIDRVFSGAGQCYRLEGDEFSVILPDPQRLETTWIEELRHRLEEYNKANRCEVTLVWGMSRLRKEDGGRKRVSDWKYEADKALHEDKGRRSDV